MTLTSIIQKRALFGASLDVTGNAKSASLDVTGNAKAGSVQIRPTVSVDNSPDLDITNPANQSIKAYVATSAGSYNPLTQANDKAIIFTDGTTNTGDLVIGPLATTTPKGIRIVGSSGNVGIGIALPTEKLHVEGNAKIEDGSVSVTNGSVVVTQNSTTPAVRITQTGTGNALVVEDSANPDASPFVIDADGNVGIRTTSPTADLHVNGTLRLDLPATPGAGGLAGYLVFSYGGTDKKIPFYNV